MVERTTLSMILIMQSLLVHFEAYSRTSKQANQRYFKKKHALCTRSVFKKECVYKYTNHCVWITASAN